MTCLPPSHAPSLSRSFTPSLPLPSLPSQLTRFPHSSLVSLTLPLPSLPRLSRSRFPHSSLVSSKRIVESRVGRKEEKVNHIFLAEAEHQNSVKSGSSQSMPKVIRHGSMATLNTEFYVDGERSKSRSCGGVGIVGVEDRYLVGDAIGAVFVDGDDKVIAVSLEVARGGEIRGYVSITLELQDHGIPCNIGDGVRGIARAKVVGVCARAAIQDVVARTAIQDVVARATSQGIVSRAAQKAIVPRITRENVAAVPPPSGR